MGLGLVPGTGWERGSKCRQKNAPEVSEKRFLAPFFQSSQPDGRCKNFKSSHNHFGEGASVSSTVILSHRFVGQRTSLYHEIKHVSPSISCFVTNLRSLETWQGLFVDKRLPKYLIERGFRLFSWPAVQFANNLIFLVSCGSEGLTKVFETHF